MSNCSALCCRWFRPSDLIIPSDLVICHWGLRVKVHGEPPFVFRMHWDHEHGLARSSRRESAQTSPMKNERTHVRCYTVHGEPDGLTAATCDHEPDNALGARLCEPQHAGILKTHGLSRKRSGWRRCCGSHTRAPARLGEPQRAATAPSPAGHGPALRDGRFMEREPRRFFSALGAENRGGQKPCHICNRELDQRSEDSLSPQ